MSERGLKTGARFTHMLPMIEEVELLIDEIIHRRI